MVLVGVHSRNGLSSRLRILLNATLTNLLVWSLRFFAIHQQGKHILSLAMTNRSGPGELVAFACIPCRHDLSPSRAVQVGEKKRCCFRGALSQLGTTHFPRPCMLFTAAHILELDGHPGQTDSREHSIRVHILAAKPFPEILWELWLPKILEEPASKCLLDAIRLLVLS